MTSAEKTAYVPEKGVPHPAIDNMQVFVGQREVWVPREAVEFAASKIMENTGHYFPVHWYTPGLAVVLSALQVAGVIVFTGDK